MDSNINKKMHISIVKPTRCTIFFRVYWISLYMFRSFRQSSGVQNCTYSIRYTSY